MREDTAGVRTHPEGHPVSQGPSSRTRVLRVGARELGAQWGRGEPREGLAGPSPPSGLQPYPRPLRPRSLFQLCRRGEGDSGWQRPLPGRRVEARPPASPGARPPPLLPWPGCKSLLLLESAEGRSPPVAVCRALLRAGGRQTAGGREGLTGTRTGGLGAAPQVSWKPVPGCPARQRPTRLCEGEKSRDVMSQPPFTDLHIIVSFP